MIPELMSIIWSRQQSEFPLQSFCIWGTSDQQAPLELVDGSQISLEGFESLAGVSAMKRGNLVELLVSRFVENLFKASGKSSAVSPQV